MELCQPCIFLPLKIHVALEMVVTEHMLTETSCKISNTGQGFGQLNEVAQISHFGSVRDLYMFPQAYRVRCYSQVSSQ